ncbi:hypothetical protein KM043_007627 [Ampulex compressa]|nr:hypothetical protein KM043_007627 [Ampulex compressa]
MRSVATRTKIWSARKRGRRAVGVSKRADEFGAGTRMTDARKGDAKRPEEDENRVRARGKEWTRSVQVQQRRMQGLTRERERRRTEAICAKVRRGWKCDVHRRKRDEKRREEDENAIRLEGARGAERLVEKEEEDPCVRCEREKVGCKVRERTRKERGDPP